MLRLMHTYGHNKADDLGKLRHARSEDHAASSERWGLCVGHAAAPQTTKPNRTATATPRIAPSRCRDALLKPLHRHLQHDMNKWRPRSQVCGDELDAPGIEMCVDL